MVPQRRFGYIPDPLDVRDRKFATLLGSRKLSGAPQISVNFVQRVPEILDQGDLGSCTAQAALGAIRLKHVLDGIRSPLLASRLLTYWGTRKYLGTVNWDSGGHLRDTFKFLNGFGYLPERETVNGYNIQKFKAAPTPLELRRMYDQRDKSDGQVEYFRIYEEGVLRINAIRRAISNRMPVVLGTDTTEAFLSNSGELLLRPSETARSTGGHAMYVCGYDALGVYIPNSWGRSHGRDGILHMSWDYVAWEHTRDIWAVAKAPYYSHLRDGEDVA